MVRFKTAVSFVFCVCFAVSVFYIATQSVFQISYYATFESGETVKVDSIIAVPILSVEQIDRMWPEYHIETKVKVAGKEITLRSKPFLFCDNPELEGSYVGRDVYCPLAERSEQ